MAAPSSSSSQMDVRRKAAFLLVAVAVVAAVLAGVLVPRRDRPRAASSILPGEVGTVHIVDKAPVSVVDGGASSAVLDALATGNKLPAPAANATTASTAAGVAGTKTTTTSSSSSSSSGGGGGGLFGGLLSGAQPTAGGAGGVSTRGWAALEGSGATVCRPRNGTELVQMVTRSPCTVVVLQPSVNYNVTKTMNVTTTKIVIGNPVFLPTLTPAKGVTRLFDVLAGGRLDVRALQMLRGDPERYDERTLRLFQGSVVRVLLGGSFSASWCIFTQPVQQLETFIRDLDNPRNRVRIFGGFVLVLGGDLTIFGCIMYRFNQYGNAIINTMQVGRDVLVVAGNAILTGWYSIMANLLTASINVGNAAAVLGGTLTWAGGAVINAGVVNAHYGTGQLVFVGGGTLITVGVHNVGAFAAIMRAGAGQFGVGAGVKMHIGHMQPRAWGVANVWNAGQTHFVGAGISHKHGEGIATTAINYVFAGAGAHLYLGSGDLTWVGISAGRSQLTASLSGLGGIYYNGGGTTNFVGVPSAGFALVRSRFMLGGELFHGGGSVEWIHCKRYAAFGWDFWTGLGTNIFSGGGDVVFVNTKAKTVRRKYFQRPKTPGAIWVGGTKVPGAKANTNIIATGQGVRPLGSAHNKTAGGGKQRELRHFFGRHRRPSRRQRALLDGAAAAAAEPVTPAVVSLNGDEATRTRLLLVRSSFQDQLGSGAVGSSKDLVDALSAVDQVGALLERLDAAAAAAATADGGSTGISVPKDAQCLVCDGANGPESAVTQLGEGACLVSDACTATKSAEALAQAKQAAAAATTVAQPPVSTADVDLMALVDGQNNDAGEPLPDIFYLWHELAVYCPSAAAGVVTSPDACISEAVLKQAVKAWLAGALGTDTGVSVTAASTAVPAVASHLVDQDLLDATHAAPPLEAGCTDGFRFHVYATTIDPALQQPLQDAWAALVQDPEPLLLAVESAGGAATATVPCALTATRKAAIVYPPLERMEPFKPPTATGLGGLVGPSVVLGGATAIAPVDHVVRGRAYPIFLQNFPAGQAVELRLVGADAALAAAAGATDAVSVLEGAPLATVASFDDDGLTELSWAVPEGLDEGRYYVRAAAGPGGALFATSQPFAVVAAPLTGPSRRWRYG